jgi:FAD/FMN-containing dehydrogenase
VQKAVARLVEISPPMLVVSQLLRYGDMRNLVLGLEVVLLDGRIGNGLSGLRKDNMSYDLRSLFVGSEETLGIITGAVLKLFPKPTVKKTTWVTSPDLGHLVTLPTNLRSRCGERLTAFEMMSQDSLDLVLKYATEARAPKDRSAFNTLIELSDTEDTGLQAILENELSRAVTDGLIDGAVMATSQAQVSALWKLREGISQAQVRASIVIKHDIVLPLSALTAFVTQADAAALGAATAIGTSSQIINFGHLGDGNLHYNVLLTTDLSQAAIRDYTVLINRVVHDLVVVYNGSISAEHGIGQLRREELRRYRSPLEIELILRIKRAFDPNQIMNPGKLL